jgi:bifunctional DNase/RNase
VIEVVVAGLGVVPPGSASLLLLKERGSDRVLPVGVGPLEAQAIALPLQGVRPPRPMTHDVFAEAIGQLGGHLLRVDITDLVDDTFVARLVFEQAGQERALDIRPSDAVALAVRTETPIYVAEAVMGMASVEIDDASEATTPTTPVEPGDELDESKLSPFREFIDNLNLDDLDPGEPEQRP